MKRVRYVFVAGAALLFATAALCADPLPPDTMCAVRTMLRAAQKPFQDNLTLDYEIIELDYSFPEVFFGMIRLQGDWPVERRKAALDAYLAVMADTDFTDQTDNDRDLPFKATAQCADMNYTNALPYMPFSRIALTLRGKTAESVLTTPLKLLRQVSPIWSRKAYVTGQLVYLPTMRQSGSCTVNMTYFGENIMQDTP